MAWKMILSFWDTIFKGRLLFGHWKAQVMPFLFGPFWQLRAVVASLRCAQRATKMSKQRKYTPKPTLSDVFCCYFLAFLKKFWRCGLILFMAWLGFSITTT